MQDSQKISAGSLVVLVYLPELGLPKRGMTSARDKRSSCLKQSALYGSIHRILTIGGSITVQLTSCLTGLDLTNQAKMLFIQQKQSS